MPDAVYKQILDQVVTDIKSLSLSGITEANIKALKKITTRPADLSPPTVLVAPFGNKAPAPTAGTNASDDIPYKVMIVTIEAGNQDQTSNLNRHLQWDEDIRKQFISRPLSGISATGLKRGPTRMLVDNAYDTPAWLQQYDASVMVFEFTMREQHN